MVDKFPRSEPFVRPDYTGAVENVTSDAATEPSAPSPTRASRPGYQLGARSDPSSPRLPSREGTRGTGSRAPQQPNLALLHSSPAREAGPTPRYEVAVAPSFGDAALSATPQGSANVDSPGDPEQPGGNPGSRRAKPAHKLSVGQLLKDGFFKINAVSALDPAHDLYFRQRIEGGGRAEHFNMRNLRQDLEMVKGGIRDAEMPEEIKATLRLDIEDIESDIASITNDKKLQHYVGIVAVRLALTPLPILLPLLAEPKQYHGAAVAIGSYFHTNTLGFGLFRNPTADWKVILDHVVNRDFANTLQNVLLLALAFHVAFAHDVPYNAAVGATAFAALMLMFFGGPFLKAQYRQMRYGAAKPSRLGDYVERLSPESKDFLRQMAVCIDKHRADLSVDRETFKEAERHRLTDSFNWQVSQILGAAQRLVDDMRRAAGVPAPAKPDRNRHRVLKSIVFCMSVGFLVAPIVPVTGLFIRKEGPETIPLVDLLIDTLSSLAKMAVTVRDPSTDFQDAMDVFKQWVGYSGVMAYCFGANAAAGDPVSKGGKAFAAFAAGLSIANCTVSTPQGLAVAALVTAIVEKFRRGDVEGARQGLQDFGAGIMDELDALSLNNLPPAPHLPDGLPDDRITELNDDDDISTYWGPVFDAMGGPPNAGTSVESSVEDLLRT